MINENSVMKMTSLDNMNIIKDLFLVPNEPVIKEEDKEKGEIVENATILASCSVITISIYFTSL